MNPYGAGWHLDRALFDETLREMCGPVLRKGKFMAIRRIDDQTEPPYGWEMSAEMVGSGAVETFRAKWIVDATGRRASVARKVCRYRISCHCLCLTRHHTARSEGAKARGAALLLRPLWPI